MAYLSITALTLTLTLLTLTLALALNKSAQCTGLLFLEYTVRKHAAYKQSFPL